MIGLHYLLKLLNEAVFNTVLVFIYKIMYSLSQYLFITTYTYLLEDNSFIRYEFERISI